ncbi:MAG: hypothetical protein ACJ8AW_41610 [Rhodopila sp.]|jgi:hypothetical protein
MDIESALAAIQTQPTMPNVLETVKQVWQTRPSHDGDFERRFYGLLDYVWHRSTCNDPELLALYAQAADLRVWGCPVFATDEEVLSFHPHAASSDAFLTETWTELEWDGGSPVSVSPMTSLADAGKRRNVSAWF